MNDIEQRPKVTVKFSLSSTTGKEGYEIVTTESVIEEDVVGAMESALALRHFAREAIGLEIRECCHDNCAEAYADGKKAEAEL